MSGDCLVVTSVILSLSGGRLVVVTAVLCLFVKWLVAYDYCRAVFVCHMIVWL